MVMQLAFNVCDPKTRITYIWLPSSLEEGRCDAITSIYEIIYSYQATTIQKPEKVKVTARQTN